MTERAKQSVDTAWQWATRIFLIMIAIIGFFIANTLSGMEKSTDEAEEERDELKKEINLIQRNAERSDERYIHIQRSLNEIKDKLK
jgi:chaperonin cofactor prefoldin